MQIKWIRTVQAARLLPGDYIRTADVDLHVQAAQLIPDEVQPAVGLVLRTPDGRDRRVRIDATEPVALLEVAA